MDTCPRPFQLVVPCKLCSVKLSRDSSSVHFNTLTCLLMDVLAKSELSYPQASNEPSKGSGIWGPTQTRYLLEGNQP